MLFHVSWEFIDTTEEGERRLLDVFSNWQPPAETDFSGGFYGFADGNGGFALVETDSAAAIARAASPFTPWMSFTTRPILPIQESAQISGEGVAFRDSVQ